MKNCDIYPNFHVNKAVKEEWYRPKGKIHSCKSLAEVRLRVLMDRTVSRIIMAQNMPQILFWTTFLKNSPSFKNGFEMEALDTANTSNGDSDRDIFITSVVPLKVVFYKNTWR